MLGLWRFLTPEHNMPLFLDHINYIVNYILFCMDITRFPPGSLQLYNILLIIYRNGNGCCILIRPLHLYTLQPTINFFSFLFMTEIKKKKKGFISEPTVHLDPYMLYIYIYIYS